jgi:hypothetical protein
VSYKKTSVMTACPVRLQWFNSIKSSGRSAEMKF